MTEPHRQPWLHDLVVVVDAPAQAISGRDGQIRASGVHGIFMSDVRLLSQLVLTVDGLEPEPVLCEVMGIGAARFVGLLKTLGDPIADPTVRLERRRTVTPSRCTEEIAIRNSSRQIVRCELVAHVAADFADLRDVKVGKPAEVAPMHRVKGAVRWEGPDIGVELRATPAGATGEPGGLRWPLEVPPGGTATVSIALEAQPAARASIAAAMPTESMPWGTPRIRCHDDRLDRLVQRSLDDLAGLLLADPDAPNDCYLGAGAPWFLTLFGRDSIWSARMLLPLGTGLAAGTLRTLARRQGVRVDPQTAEQPGKILHEVRRASGAATDRRLPPLYYGTIDATPLWVMLLHDAWRWGMAEREVEALLPAAEAALVWMRDYGDSDGDGFLEYADESGRGLANQGWKDSHDSVQFADGTLAVGPIALCEVQGYAYEAALSGAALLDAFGRPGGDEWRSWADQLRARFRAAFWIDDPLGPYPAVALDRDKRPVDALASNMGHLLGTGLLDPAEAALVARRLGSPAMDSGFGLRTMAAHSARFNPLGYHTGSVWPHDTAVAVVGLARTGHGAVAGALAAGLLEAAPAFDFRIPELYGGEGPPSAQPLPYPAACRPQAWAASTVMALISGLLGVEADVPGGRLAVRPVQPFPWTFLHVSGLRMGGQRLDLRVADGKAEILAAPPGMSLVVG